ncbi:MAG: hypothetical protein L6437_07095 [Kiritimatiellae bacterium]|nr:hypothetical protein [Kiritimatiellia bacterium]
MTHKIKICPKKNIRDARCKNMTAALAAGLSCLCAAVPAPARADVLISPTVTPSNQLIGWAAGGSQDGYATILNTTNGGGDWVRQGSSEEIVDTTLSCVAATDAHTAWAVGLNAQGYSVIYHTTNGGSAWLRQGTRDTVGNVELAKISACNREVVWIGGAEGTVLRTMDGGQTWQDRSPSGYTNMFQGITALDANIAWAAGHIQDGYAPILHTTNGGLSWVRQSGGDATNLANILSIGAADSMRLWAVGFGYDEHRSMDGRILGTTNGGMTWELLYHNQSGGYHANELYVVNTAQVYVAMDTSVIKTMDGGRSWEQVGIRSTPYATMGICAPDGQNIWAASENWASGFIFHIPPGGTDWIDQTPSNGVAMLDYISFVRLTPPSSMGTFAITVTPGNGIWTINGPPVGYAGPLCGTGSLATVQSPEGYYNVSFTARPGFRTPSSQTILVTPGQASVITGLYLSRQTGDYDGDGKTDPALYNGQSGDWIVSLSEHGYQHVTFNFGGSGWMPVAGDFDGDGRSDPCVVQTASGVWAAMMSGNEYTTEWISCGAAGFQPVRGDFDGDAKSDLTMYRETDGLWSMRFSSLGYKETLFMLGGIGWSAVVGDFDGDGKADPGVYEGGSGKWQVLLSANGYVPAQVQSLQLTDYSLQPVPSDYDGDRKTDPGVYNEENGAWTILYSGNAYAPATRFCGWTGFCPVIGDFDGDDLADYTVYGTIQGFWMSLLSEAGYTSSNIPMGDDSFAPVW